MSFYRVHFHTEIVNLTISLYLPMLFAHGYVWTGMVQHQCLNSWLV